MRPDHRHELKTNELAEWLSNLPQWTRENRTFIILVLAVIIVVAFLYIQRIHSKNIATRKQLELTNLAGQLLRGKMQILQAQRKGKDLSFILLQPAENLRIFAENTNDDQMAAFALIKQAEALQAELLYRMGTMPEQEKATQINRAKDSYTKALERCLTNPSLMAVAKFGLGLCEEELGNFEVAEQIYRDITANPDFEGAVAAVQAKLRLETITDYKQKIVFRPAPKPKPAAPAQPPTQPKPVDTNLPIDINSALEAPDTNASPITLKSTIEANDIEQSSK